MAKKHKPGKNIIKLTNIYFKDTDSKSHICYIPSLGITGYGETKEKAEELADFCSKHFFYDRRVRTIVKELQQLGFKNIKENKDGNFVFQEPKFSDMIKNIEDLKDVVENKSYTKKERETIIP